MIKVAAFRQPYRCNGISVFVEDVTGGQVALAPPVILRTLSPDELYQTLEPTFTLPFESAQKLMDDLWDCGIRPSEGSGSAGQLKAVQNHLADFRKIVAKKLQIDF